MADRSALARLRHPPVAARLGPLLVDGLVATCPIIDLEVLYGARSASDYEAILQERRALPSFPITADVTDRAIDVQQRLAAQARHRLAIPDLLIAAVAEQNDLLVLHYDADYDRSADIPGQRPVWVVARGSV
jgi:predicted nucleic acid-binding protein